MKLGWAFLGVIVLYFYVHILFKGNHVSERTAAAVSGVVLTVLSGER